MCGKVDVAEVSAAKKIDGVRAFHFKSCTLVHDNEFLVNILKVVARSKQN